MPHEPLTGDALLDALSEVPGDPAEPVARVVSPHKQPDPPPESGALIERPRVITWDPVPLAITSWRVFINPTEEEDPE